LPDIQSIAAQYNARIHELRGEGMDIQNKTKKINGKRYSWYCFVPAQVVTAPKPEETMPEVVLESEPLKADLTLERDGQYSMAIPQTSLF